MSKNDLDNSRNLYLPDNQDATATTTTTTTSTISSSSITTTTATSTNTTINSSHEIILMFVHIATYIDTTGKDQITN